MIGSFCITEPIIILLSSDSRKNNSYFFWIILKIDLYLCKEKQKIKS